MVGIAAGLRIADIVEALPAAELKSGNGP